MHMARELDDELVTLDACGARVQLEGFQRGATGEVDLTETWWDFHRKVLELAQ